MAAATTLGEGGLLSRPGKGTSLFHSNSHILPHNNVGDVIFLMYCGPKQTHAAKREITAYKFTLRRR